MCVGVLYPGARLLRPAGMSPGSCVVVGVGEQLSSVGLCALMQCRQCRQVEADICDTGSSASLRVLGTIHVLPSRYMMLLTKSCLMLLS